MQLYHKSNNIEKKVQGEKIKRYICYAYTMAESLSGSHTYCLLLHYKNPLVFSWAIFVIIVCMMRQVLTMKLYLLGTHYVKQAVLELTEIDLSLPPKS